MSNGWNARFLREDENHVLKIVAICNTDYDFDKKLSCCRETAQRFMSLNISLSHSRSLKVIRNHTVKTVAVSNTLQNLYAKTQRRP